jgi:electron transfer flavoprotein alpha subunit
MSRLRRDPRAERAAQQVAPQDGAAPRPRYDRTRRATGGCPRRDPRAERAGQRVAGGARPRYEIGQVSRGDGPVLALHPQAAPEAAAKILIVEAPAFLVAVVPDAAGGRLSAHDRQVLGAARALAGREGGVVIVAPEACEGCGPAGADRRICLGDDAAGYDPAARAGHLAVILAALGPRHVLFPESLDGGDLARRVAARLREPLFGNAEVVAANGVIRPARGRRVEQRAAPGFLTTVAPDAVAEYGGPPREARLLAVEAAPVAVRSGPIQSATRIPADPATVPLTLADFVTAAGNGIRDLDTFRRLVTALRATPGASRVLCDAGLMPRQTQVGASGTVLAATCYFALGISGAPQHLQGVAGCEHVVAVNTDLHAAMIERAGLAIVQDAHVVMEALLRLLAEETDGTGEVS